MSAPTERLAVFAAVSCWYLTSFCTLLLNKYLLTTLRVQPNSLASVQMISAAVYGSLSAYGIQPLLTLPKQFLSELRFGSTDDSFFFRVFTRCLDHRRYRGFVQMGFIGGMRFATVMLGLVSLQYVAASFTETIKSSAPFFTVIIAYLMLGETTTPLVMLSLVPVAGGLAMVSLSELSFNAIGFGAAVATNVIECVQNVFSKRLLADEYTPSTLQFYTSVTALVLQSPFLALSFLRTVADEEVQVARGSALGNNTVGESALSGESSFNPEDHVALLLWIDGVSYHAQSVVAYVVMSHLSPVTVSVVNTLKRSILIWISVLVFGNTVTNEAQFGTMVCISGALWYSIVKQQKTPAPAPTGLRDVKEGRELEVRG
eukprot:TRINITY_DN77371_c0_g1_i1.p1 TRINITY_DN77371_c0_g1~~TRINITY_DN77371_c0_g1_i1.p1  ORF type:complete len:373 (+),score=28.17 TRINITY_DN77371_c0_g1_i1:77-1195(+)